MRFKRYIANLLIGISLLSLVGCDGTNANTNIYTPNEVTKTNNSSENITKSMDNLNNAKEITVTKDLISLNNSYSIATDGSDFGKITGEYVHITGDKFTLKDNKENELSSEKQIKRWNVKLNRLAEVYDYDGNVVGYIGEEVIKDMFKLGYVFHFYDKDKNKIGTSKQKVLSLLDTFKIYDINDNLCFEINSEFTLVSDKYTITVHDNNSIPTDQVVYLTAILNSIKRANSKKK